MALILVDAAGESVIVVAPGANRRLAAADVHVGDADAVICQLEIPSEAIAAAANEGRDRVQALVRACAAGALAASRSGAQPSLPTAAELDAIRCE